MTAHLFPAVDYFRGVVMGIFLVLLAQGILIYRYVMPLFDPSRRFIPPSDGDRPSFAKDFPRGIGKPDASDATAANAAAKANVGHADEELREEAGKAQDAKDGGDKEKSQQPEKIPTRPIQEHVEPWPDNIVQFLRNALTPDDGDVPVSAPVVDKFRAKGSNEPTPSAHSAAVPSPGTAHPPIEPVAVGPTEPCHWANVIVQRFFLALRGSELFKNKFKANTNEKINLKLKGNSFVSHIQITDLSLGENAPRIHGVRLLKGITDDLAVLAEVDLTYNGGASIAIETTLAGGLKLPVRVYLNPLAGRVRVRCPSTRYADMIGVAFVEDPGASFRVDSPITVRGSEYVRDMVNKLLASVVRKVFLEMWVLPSWRTFFLPLMTPKLEDVMARENAAKLAANAAPSSSTTAATDKKSTTNRLWETRGAPLLRRSNSASTLLGDVLSGKSFPITHRVNLIAPEADKLESQLVPEFLILAREGDGDQKTETKPVATVPGGAADGSSGSPVSADGSVKGELASAHGRWKTVRNRAGVTLQKKRVMVGGQTAEVVRASVTVQCDADRVFAVLSNPEHNRHVEEAYLGSNVLHLFDDSRDVRQATYQFGRQVREYTVFEVKRRLQEVPASLMEAAAHAGENGIPVGMLEPFVVVMRSVGGVVSDTAKNEALERGVEGKAGSVDCVSIEAMPVGQEMEDREATQAGVSASEDDLSIRSAPVPIREAASSSVLGRGRSSSELVGITESPGADAPTDTLGAADGSTRTATTPTAISGTVAIPPSNTPQSNVYLFGFYIEPVATDPENACRITVVSQLALDLSRLDVSIDGIRKIKGFIEELVNLTSMAAAREGGGFGIMSQRKGKLFNFGTSPSAGEGEGKRIEKIRNVLGSAQSYLRGKKVGGWLGVGGATGGSGLGGTPGLLHGAVGSGEVTEEESGDEKERERERHGEKGYDEDDAGFVGGVATLEEDIPAANFVANNSTGIGTNAIGAGSSPSERTEDTLSATSSSRRTLGLGRAATWGKSLASASAGGQFGTAGGYTNLGSSSGLLPPDSPAFDNMCFSERIVPARDMVRVEIPFERAAFGKCVALRWEWACRADADVQFTVLFRPAHIGRPEDGIVTLLPYQVGEVDARVLFPLTTVHAHARPVRGDSLVSSFPDGAFILIWDGTTVSKKVNKSIAYRVGITDIEAPISHGPLRGWRVGIGWYGGEIGIPRKGLARFLVPWDGSLDVGDEDEQAVLRWEFSTGGYDVMFGVMYIPLEEGREKGIGDAAPMVVIDDVGAEGKKRGDGGPRAGTGQLAGTTDYVSDSEELEREIAREAKEVADLVKDDAGMAVLADVTASVTEAGITGKTEGLEGAASGQKERRAVLDEPDAPPPPRKPLRSSLTKLDNKDVVGDVQPVGAHVTTTLGGAPSSPPPPPPPKPPRAGSDAALNAPEEDLVSLSKRPSLSERLAAAVGREREASTSGSEGGGLTSAGSVPVSPQPGRSITSNTPEHQHGHTGLASALNGATAAMQLAVAVAPKSTVAAKLANRLAASRQAVLAHAPPPQPFVDAASGSLPVPDSALSTSPALGTTPTNMSIEYAQVASAPGRPQSVYIVLPSKVNSQKGVVVGSVDVSGKRGVFAIVFDNGFSVMIGKNIAVRVGCFVGK